MWGVRSLLRPAMSLQVSRRQMKVSVVGAASELGQAVSLLLRSEPGIARLSVHDCPTQAARLYVDLAHIPLPGQIEGYAGRDSLIKSLSEADLVIAIGGDTTRQNYSNRNFDAEAGFIKRFAEALALVRPMPFVGIATEPVSVLVPLAAEIIKSNGDYDPRRMFGITNLDALRAQSMYAEVCNLSAAACSVPVVCGHSAATIVPLFSQALPLRALNAARIKDLTERVRFAAQFVTAAKNGEPPTLSAAHAILRFVRSVQGALSGRSRPAVNAFVECNDFGTSFFAGRTILTADGAGPLTKYNNLSPFEIDLLEYSIGQLRDEVMTGKRIIEMA